MVNSGISKSYRSVNELNLFLKSVHDHSQTLVFTNGVFDLLHPGHVDYLQKAAALGDQLLVGVNSDESVKGLGKGAGRPIQDEISRAFILEHLQSVSHVHLFDEQTPLSFIQKVQPQVLVKGGDYDAECRDPNQKTYIVGSQEVRSWGGVVKTIEFLDGYSTTAIESKIFHSLSKPKC